jgi:hypothetical protein
MIAAEELRLMDAKEASASEYPKPEIEGIQETRPRGDGKRWRLGLGVKCCEECCRVYDRLI